METITIKAEIVQLGHYYILRTVPERMEIARQIEKRFLMNSVHKIKSWLPSNIIFSVEDTTK